MEPLLLPILGSASASILEINAADELRRGFSVLSHFCEKKNSVSQTFVGLCLFNSLTLHTQRKMDGSLLMTRQSSLPLRKRISSKK